MKKYLIIVAHVFIGSWLILAFINSLFYNNYTLLNISFGLGAIGFLSLTAYEFIVCYQVRKIKKSLSKDLEYVKHLSGLDESQILNMRNNKK